MLHKDSDEARRQQARQGQEEGNLKLNVLLILTFLHYVLLKLEMTAR